MSVSVCKQRRTRSESQSDPGVGKGADGANRIVSPALLGLLRCRPRVVLGRERQAARGLSYAELLARTPGDEETLAFVLRR